MIKKHVKSTKKCQKMKNNREKEPKNTKTSMQTLKELILV